MVKLTGLNPLQSRGLREVFASEIEDGTIEVTASTATFHLEPVAAYDLVANAILRLPGRAHPKASLHAVRRKLLREIE